MDVLHEDDPGRVVRMPDGRVVRNLTAEEYDATYADGGPCNDPDAIAAALRDAGVE